MRPSIRGIDVAAALALAISAVGAAAQPADANKLKDVLTGDAKGPASANARCRLFTPAEIKGFLGRAVGAGENAAGGSGCMWNNADDGDASVQVVEARYAVAPTLVKGYKPLPAIGPKAWVAPDMGWTAGSVVGDVAVVVNLGGKTASEAGAVAMLQKALERMRR